MTSKSKEQKNKRTKEQTIENLSDPSILSVPSNPSSSSPAASGGSTPQTMEELLVQEHISFTPLKRGDKVKAKILKIGRKEVVADIGAKSYGVIVGREFELTEHMLSSLTVGDVVDAEVIIPEMDEGETLISVRRMLSRRVWDSLTSARDEKTELKVIGERVIGPGLLVAYQSLRGFIPSQQLDPSHQDNPDKLVGHSIPVVVLEVDQAQNRLVMSEKEVTRKEELEKARAALSTYTVGLKVKGTISAIEPYALLVAVKKVKQTAEGSVHISEVSWERVDDLHGRFKMGEAIEAQVMGHDMQEGVLILSMKQLMPDPWADVEKKYSKESTVSGTVVKVSNLGAFVELEKAVEGLIHISKIPAGKEFKEGEKVSVIVDKLDKDNRKISLAYVPVTKPIGYR